MAIYIGKIQHHKLFTISFLTNESTIYKNANQLTNEKIKCADSPRESKALHCSRVRHPRTKTHLDWLLYHEKNERHCFVLTISDHLKT